MRNENTQQLTSMKYFQVRATPSAEQATEPMA